MGKGIVLRVEALTKRFGNLYALRDVSFEVKGGECLGIIGPNGSGKTTLINCVTGFIKADKGRIIFNDKNITNMPPHKIANIGLVRTFQIMRPYYSLPAYKNLIVPLFSPRARKRGGWRGGGRLGDREAVSIDILEEIGFERDSFTPYKLASALPTGYLKRLELARCLALDPQLILCDEIFSGLTVSEINSLLPLMERLKLQGVTLIMVEHRLRELLKLSDRILVLNFGEVLLEGRPEDVIHDKRMRDAYLGEE